MMREKATVMWEKIKKVLLNIALGIAIFIVAVLVILGLWKLKEFHDEKIDSNTDVRTIGDNGDRAGKEGVARFRDRVEQALRGIFSGRGITDSNTNSGGGNNQDSLPSVSGSTIGSTPIREEGSRTGTNVAVSGGNRIGNRDSRDSLRYDSNAIKVDHPALLGRLEGALLRKYGQRIACLIAPTQMLSRELTTDEFIQVYNQGRKDPAVIDKYCVVGPKEHLLGYHTSKIVGNPHYVINVGVLAGEEIFFHSWVDGTEFDFILNERLDGFELTDKNGKTIYLPREAPPKGRVVNRLVYRII